MKPFLGNLASSVRLRPDGRALTEMLAAGDRDVARARWLARVLDNYFVDPLLGTFLPGIGDVIGSVLGLYVVAVAVKRRVSVVVIARMLLNLSVDALVGVVPVIGDVFDFQFKANRRNVELLADRAAAGGRAHARDYAVLVGACALLLGTIGAVVYAIVALARAL